MLCLPTMWHLHCALVAFTSIFGNADALVARQYDGATAASTYLRRGYHASLVAGNFVYIDGGEFSKDYHGDVNYEYSNTLLAIDLSKDWTNSTVILHSTSKPTSIPSLSQGGLWYDESADIIYTGFAGITSFFNTTELDPWPMGVWSFTPDGQGSGTWDTTLESDNSVFESITRPFLAATASGNSVGYALGGSLTWRSAPDTVEDKNALVNIDGMLRFDMATKELTNVTIEGPRFHNGHVQHAKMLYVPNFGPEGVFLVLGGVEHHPATDTLDWGTVTVFDPKEEKWYDQETSGNIPQGRKEFCVTGLASDNHTYEIFVYAGWGGDLYSQSQQFDQIYILTLPAFHWIKVDYGPTGTRHALTCHAVGGSQILTIGGLDTASMDTGDSLYTEAFDDKDKYTQGLAIFDMNTLGWKHEYKADPDPYTQSDSVRTYYAKNNRQPTFNSTELKTAFDTTNFTSTNTANSSHSATASDTSQSSKPLTTAATAGIAAGAVIGALALIGSLLFLSNLRNRRLERKAGQAQGKHQQYHALASPMPEMQDDEDAGLAHGEQIQTSEMDGAAEQTSQRKNTTNAAADLPGYEAERNPNRRSRGTW